MKKGIETERKLIILKPDIAVLRAQPDFTESNITQIYLAAPDGETHRVRMRVKDGKPVYTETVKRRISYMSVIEEERKISAAEYSELSARIARGTHPIVKTRYTFAYHGRIVEIDVYPQWSRHCILEIELASEDEELYIPPFIIPVRDVTGVREYSNASMSVAFPEEDDQ